MRKMTISAAVFALLVTAALGPQAAAAQEAKGIQGAWILTDAEGQQRGLFVFTAANYSMMYVQGDQPRAVLPENPTTEQRLASYGEIRANSGRYTLEGDQLTLEAYMALGASYMAGWPDNDRTVTVKVEGDTMTMTAGDRTFAMRRVE